MLYGAQAVLNSRLYNEWNAPTLSDTATSTGSLTCSANSAQALTVFLTALFENTLPNPLGAEAMRASDWIGLVLTRPSPWAGDLEDFDNGQV